jgi:hypothetical protein
MDINGTVDNKNVFHFDDLGEFFIQIFFIWQKKLHLNLNYFKQYLNLANQK